MSRRSKLHPVGDPGRLGFMHRPRFYRYEVAFPARLRFTADTYPGTCIGVAVTVGRYAYCVQWGSA